MRLVPFLPLVALAACSKPATPTEVREELLADLPALYADLDATGRRVADTELAGELDTTFSALADAFPELFGRVTTQALKLPADPAETEAELRELVETIFSDANHEGDGVYRVHGTAVCGEATDEGYADCVETVEALELRIRAELDDETTLTFMVGPDRAAPLAIVVDANLFDVSFDLAGARGAILHYADVTGESVELPGTMRGRISATLERNAPLDWTATLAIRQAIELAGSVDAGTVSLAVAARDPLIAIRANAAAVKAELSVQVDIGPIGFSVPWQAVEPDSAITAQLVGDLRGFTAAISFIEGGALILSDVGFGDGTSTVVLGDVTLFGFTWNDGGTTDLTVIPVEGALPRLTFAPAVEAEIAVNFAPLAEEDVGIEPWLMGDVYTFSTGTELQPIAWSQTFPGGIRSIDGGIRLANDDGIALDVPEGKCLVEDVVTDGEHPLIGRFAAVVCP